MRRSLSDPPRSDGIFPLKAVVSRRRGDYSNIQSTFLTHKFCRLTAASATPTEVLWLIDWNPKKNRLVSRWKSGGSQEGLDAPARKQMECTTEVIPTEPPSAHLSSITAKHPSLVQVPLRASLQAFSACSLSLRFSQTHSRLPAAPDSPQPWSPQ